MAWNINTRTELRLLETSRIECGLINHNHRITACCLSHRAGQTLRRAQFLKTALCLVRTPQQLLHVPCMLDLLPHGWTVFAMTQLRIPSIAVMLSIYLDGIRRKFLSMTEDVCRNERA